MKKIETDSLDPIKMKSIDKVKKLVTFLLTERERVLDKLIELCDHAGHNIVSIMQQTNWAKENGRNPLWGMYGPAQGMKIEEISSFAGRLYQIDETLEAIYEMWPKLKPATPDNQSTKKTARKK